MNEKNAKCMIVCGGKKKLKITVCVDRDTGHLTKKVEQNNDCSERVFDQD